MWTAGCQSICGFHMEKDDMKTYAKDHKSLFSPGDQQFLFDLWLFPLHTFDLEESLPPPSLNESWKRWSNEGLPWVFSSQVIGAVFPRASPWCMMTYCIIWKECMFCFIGSTAWRMVSFQPSTEGGHEALQSTRGLQPSCFAGLFVGRKQGRNRWKLTGDMEWHGFGRCLLFSGHLLFPYLTWPILSHDHLMECQEFENCCKNRRLWWGLFVHYIRLFIICINNLFQSDWLQLWTHMHNGSGTALEMWQTVGSKR